MSLWSSPVLEAHVSFLFYEEDTCYYNDVNIGGFVL